MRPYRLLAALLLTAPLCLSSAAKAQTATANILVTATVLKLCTVTALPLVFGTYSSAANLDASTSITVICTPNTTYTVALGAGGGSGATTTVRRMTGALLTTNLLEYGLYRDAARAQNWGNTGGTGGDVVTGTGIIAPQLITVYGRIPLGQVVPADVYTDSVAVTLTY